MGTMLSKLALGAALALAAVGCRADQASSAGTPGSVSAAATGAASKPAEATSKAGVVADCASADPDSLSSGPSSITLACADDGIGVQDLTWTNWTASAAAGYGMLWEKLCVPDCASGEVGYYPVDVTLSGVKASARGPWFSLLTITWEGSRPPGQTPDRFTLTPPG